MKDERPARAAATVETALFVGAVAGFSSTLAESVLLYAHTRSPRAQLVHLAEAILCSGGVYFALGLLVSIGLAGILALDDLRIRSSTTFAGLSREAAQRAMLEARITTLALVVGLASAMSRLVNDAASIPSPQKRLFVVGIAVVLTMTAAVFVLRLIRRVVAYAISFFDPRRWLVALLCLVVMGSSLAMAFRLSHSQMAYSETVLAFGVGGAVLALLKRDPLPLRITRGALAACVLWLGVFFVRGTSANAYLLHRMGRTLISIVLREIPFHRNAPFEERIHKAILARLQALPHADLRHGVHAAKSQRAEAPALDRSDIVLITIDTLREDRLLGSPTKMPSLAAIAAEGALFRNTFASAPATIGAMTQLMTGRSEHDVPHLVSWNNSGALVNPATPTLSSRLLADGYETVAIVGGRLVSYYPPLGLGFSTIVEVKEDEKALSAHDIVKTFEEVLSRPERRAPLFVWVHFLDPHYHTERSAPIPEGYDSIVREVDEEVGRMYSVLKASPRFAKTTLLVLADHGEGLGERGFVYHGVSLPVVIKIPFVAHFPDEPPAVVDDLVSQLDIGPTVLAAAGLETTDLPGRALQRRLAEKKPVRQYAFFENVYYLQPLQAYEVGVAAPPWFYSFDIRERRSLLVNLADDPLGLQNLADDRPDVARRLGEALAEQLEREP